MPLPERLNVAISLAAWTAAAGLLYAASHAPSLPAKVLAAAAFSFVANTIFALLHESVHRTFSGRSAVNEGFGLVSAAFFPTGFSFQRVCHLGHHERNRSDVEAFDLYGPEDSRLLKTLQLYGILTGLYWLLPPFGCLVYLVWPGAFRLVRPRSLRAEHTGAAAMLSGFEGTPSARIRLEILFSLAFQIALAAALHLNLAGWALCYAAFALNWSSLQYADHAFSVRDVREGAWNLRVHPLVQAVFLNYHLHHAHHRHPEVSWRDLPRYVDPLLPRPRFLHVWLRMWKGPIPAGTEGSLPATEITQPAPTARVPSAS